MTRFYTITLGTLFAASLSMCVVGCTSTGKLAGKANGPIDPTVTFKNACNGAKIADGVFQAAVTASGGKIPAEDVTVEHDAFTLVAAICSGPVPTDLNSALLAITADAAPIGALVAKYSKPAS
jgi:hypothetical protein